VQDADEAVALLRPCVLFHGVLRDVLEDVDGHGDGWTGGCPVRVTASIRRAA